MKPRIAAITGKLEDTLISMADGPVIIGRQAGATELEVMTKVGWLRSEMDIAYRMHLGAVVQAVDGAPVSAILESGVLSSFPFERPRGPLSAPAQGGRRVGGALHEPFREGMIG